MNISDNLPLTIPHLSEYPSFRHFDLTRLYTSPYSSLISDRLKSNLRNSIPTNVLIQD